jgi:hypothetical protein
MAVAARSRLVPDDSSRSVPDLRVVAIEVAAPGRPDDPHPAALQLANGRQIASTRAIINLRYGIETYHVAVEGRAYRVRTVGPCPRCGLENLRADDEARAADQLMRLPASPFGPPIAHGR